MDSESYFNLKPDVIHLNHAAVAPWPNCTVAAVKAFADENGRIGSTGYAQWVNTETELRKQLARLINAPSHDDIGLLKNTSEGLSIIAYGLDWQAGDNIIIADEEFPSNRIVWESLKPLGVEVRRVKLDFENPEQRLIDQSDDRTRLLSISGVQYASGLRMDLAKLGQACQQRKIIFVVDAIQQIGAIQLDCQAINADFVIADGHKWMLGPEGLALFYCRREWRTKLKLNQFGWHMVEDLSDFNKMDHWQPASSARRFECGSPNMLAVHALHASIGLLLELGMDNIEQQVLDNVQYLINMFTKLKQVSIISPTQLDRHAGIFTFNKQGVDNEQLYQHLVARRVICALRGGGIRLSPHFYTPKQQLEQLANWVEEF
ncbi:MAG: aminotransferase class V-fold PLP-dependent enzyme [Gammaproteobacteria bacterium]|nr:aminotransferase class V-fold PLP-dependent enzyme [Gammaproteobacteria bacterium]